MSGLTFVLNDARPDDISEDHVDEETEKTNCCFVCSTPVIQLQKTTRDGQRNDKKIVQVLFQMLTGEKFDDTDNDQEEENISPVSFCSECRIYLRLWHDLMTSIIPVLEKSNQIKFTIISNILTSSKIQNPNQSSSTPTTKVSTESRCSSSSLLQQFEKITKKLRNDYSPKILLERLKQVPMPLSQLPNVEQTESFELDRQATNYAFDHIQAHPVHQTDENVDLDPDFQMSNQDLNPAYTESDYLDDDDNSKESPLVNNNNFLQNKSSSEATTTTNPRNNKHWTATGHKQFLFSGATNSETENNDNYEMTYMGIAYNFDPVNSKYKCSVCPSSVRSRLYIRAHIKNVHIDPESKFMCEVCGNTLKTEQTLQRHKLRVHITGGAATFVCQYCDKVFREKPYFDCHVAIHEKGEEAKKFQCEYCGKKFGMERELRKHVRRVHTRETLFNCLYCELKFTDRVILHKHRHTAHGVLLPKEKKKRKVNDGNC